MHKIYLAGAITHLVDPKSWRDDAANQLLYLGCEVLDPLNWEAKDFSDSEIVTLDYKLILDSVAVLVDCGQPSWGTAMELAFAKQMGRPAFGWNIPTKCSPWLREHLYSGCVHLPIAITNLNKWINRNAIG